MNVKYIELECYDTDFTGKVSKNKPTYKTMIPLGYFTFRNHSDGSCTIWSKDDSQPWFPVKSYEELKTIINDLTSISLSP